MQHTRLRDDNPVVFFDVAIGDMAAGRLLIEVGAPSILRADVVPRTAENFRRLCTGETKESRTGRRRHYARCPFHRVVKDKFCQSGDYANHDGSGGESTFGHSARRIGPIEEDPTSPRGGKQTEKLILPSTFDDENFILRHTGAGVLSMANAGPDSNTCQFYLHFAPVSVRSQLLWCPISLTYLLLHSQQSSFDGKHVVFGCLIDAESFAVLDKINVVATVRGDPKQSVKITKAGQLFPV
ncbi:hypothetical protein BBO99_00009773 [Phytophthora kernoviae]|nr:hypothetical protein G195_011609 [Phytophthora kernoviae 00238/432]RLN72614.1 hypothetical protein BBO99_00009773 [Phytophthora kernoviae]